MRTSTGAECNSATALHSCDNTATSTEMVCNQCYQCTPDLKKRGVTKPNALQHWKEAGRRRASPVKGGKEELCLALADLMGGSS